MTENLRLWHAIECPHSMRVRLVLHEKGLMYESEIVTLDDVGDDVRSKNPQGQVPVLEHGDCTLYEASVIAEYIDEVFPTPALFPADPKMRARARLLIRWADACLVDPVRALEEARAEGGLAREPVDPDLAHAMRRILDALETIGRQMQARPYVLGEFGIVDLFVAPFVGDLDALGVRRDEMPRTTALWIDRLRDRPSIADETLRREKALGLHETGT